MADSRLVGWLVARIVVGAEVGRTSRGVVRLRRGNRKWASSGGQAARYWSVGQTAGAEWVAVDGGV